MIRMSKTSGVAARKPAPTVDPATVHLLPTTGRSAITTVPAGQTLFRQGDRCEAVFYIRAGAAKVHVVAKSGREAVLMLIGPGDFFGEGCLLDNVRRLANLTTITECTIERIEIAETWQRMHIDPEFAKVFVGFLVNRNRRHLTDLSDLHFHSTEKRLARLLLRLAKIPRGDAPGSRQPSISQEMLADMIGTTRSRVNFFMNKFRRLGMIGYRGKIDDSLVVYGSLASILRD